MVKQRSAAKKEDVAATLRGLFSEASSSSLATQKKLVLKLKKCASICGSDKGLVQEFTSEFKNCLFRTLPVKKGVQAADKVVTFFGNVLATTEDGSSLVADADISEAVLSDLLKGFQAKDKNVRYRVLQLVGIIMKYTTEMTDEVYTSLRDNLFQRTYDKEITVRSVAVSCLANLQGSGDEDENQILTKRLLDIMEFDPSPDVRKSVIFNIDVDADTLPYLLRRAKDVDASVRRTLFLKMNDAGVAEQLSVQDLKKLISQGLCDRDVTVQRQCLKCICGKWVNNKDMNGLLGSIDFEDTKTAELALMYFIRKTAYKMTYSADNWKNMTRSTAFLNRVYLTYCSQAKAEDSLEAALPTLKDHVQFLHQAFTNMAEAKDENEERIYEFVFSQLLMVADLQDFSEESARREMMAFLRETLISMDLPDDIFSLIVPIIRKLSVNEQDFTSYMSDILHDIIDLSEFAAEDGSLDANIEDDEERVDLLHSCLRLSVFILQLSEKPFRETPSMEGILRQFVIPCLQMRAHKLRETAVKCLGLTTFLDKSLALKFIEVFAPLIESRNASLEKTAFEVLFDIAMFYQMSIFDHANSSSSTARIITLLRTKLKTDDADLLALIVEGITKLYLVKALDDEGIMVDLIALYFHNRSLENQRVRQCLSYFFMVFPYSLISNQKTISKAVVPFMKSIVNSLDYQAIPAVQIAQHLMDWTDVRKLIRNERDGQCIHALVAHDILQEIKRSPRSAKIYFQMLGYVALNRTVSAEAKACLAELADSVKDFPPDSVAVTAFKKFINALPKTGSKNLEDEDDQ